MGLFRLHTNEGEEVVRSTQDRLRAEMIRYIREKRAKGLTLAEIMFCWCPLHIGRTI